MKSNFLSNSSVTSTNENIQYPTNYFYLQNNLETNTTTTTTSTGEVNDNENSSDVSQENSAQLVKENNNLRDINNGKSLLFLQYSMYPIK